MKFFQKIRDAWLAWRWRKHLPKRISAWEIELFEKGSRRAVQEYLTTTKQWAGSSPTTVKEAVAKVRHRLIVSKIKKHPIHLTEDQINAMGRRMLGGG